MSYIMIVNFGKNNCLLTYMGRYMLLRYDVIWYLLNYGILIP